MKNEITVRLIFIQHPHSCTAFDHHSAPAHPVRMDIFVFDVCPLLHQFYKLGEEKLSYLLQCASVLRR